MALYSGAVEAGEEIVMKTLIAVAAAAALSGCAYYDPYVYNTPYYGSAPAYGAPYVVGPQPYYYGSTVVPYGYGGYGYPTYAYPDVYLDYRAYPRAPRVHPRTGGRPEAHAPRRDGGRRGSPGGAGGQRPSDGGGGSGYVPGGGSPRAPEGGGSGYVPGRPTTTQ